LADQSSREVAGQLASSQNFGLHEGALGAAETLAQSVSAVAPSTSSSLTIPLVFALAGNGTWLVYLMATTVILLVGFCIGRFARISASPGSLYSYTAQTLPPIFGILAAWGLLIAYIATGASVAGGALYYVSLLSHQFLNWAPPSLVTLGVVCALAGYIAYRDVKLSAEVMLWIEIASVALVMAVLAMLVFKVGLRLDPNQVKLSGVHFSSLGPALVLSIFSWAWKHAIHFEQFRARSCSVPSWPGSSSSFAHTLKFWVFTACRLTWLKQAARCTCWLPRRVCLPWELQSTLERWSACSPAYSPAQQRRHASFCTCLTRESCRIGCKAPAPFTELPRRPLS